MAASVIFSGSPLSTYPVHQSRREVATNVNISPFDGRYQLQVALAPEPEPPKTLYLEGSVGFKVTGQVQVSSFVCQLYGLGQTATRRLPGQIVPSKVPSTTYLGAVVVSGDPTAPEVAIVPGSNIYDPTSRTAKTEGAGIHADFTYEGRSYFSDPVSLTGEVVVGWTLLFKGGEVLEPYSAIVLQPIITFSNATSKGRGPYGTLFTSRMGSDPYPTTSASTRMQIEVGAAQTVGSQYSIRTPVDLAYGTTVYDEGGIYEVVSFPGDGFRYVNFSVSDEGTAGVTIIVETYPPPSYGRVLQTVQSSTSAPVTKTIPREDYYLQNNQLLSLELSTEADAPFIGVSAEGFFAVIFSDFAILRRFLSRHPLPDLSPSGAFGVPLKGTLINPANVPGMTYATELLTLNLNLIYQSRLLVVAPTKLGDLSYQGKRIYDIANDANRWYGSGQGEYVDYELIKNINESFVRGKASKWALENLYD